MTISDESMILPESSYRKGYELQLDSNGVVVTQRAASFDVTIRFATDQSFDNFMIG